MSPQEILLEISLGDLQEDCSSADKSVHCLPWAAVIGYLKSQDPILFSIWYCITYTIHSCAVYVSFSRRPHIYPSTRNIFIPSLCIPSPTQGDSSVSLESNHDALYAAMSKELTQKISCLIFRLFLISGETINNKALLLYEHLDRKNNNAKVLIHNTHYICHRQTQFLSLSLSLPHFNRIKDEGVARDDRNFPTLLRVLLIFIRVYELNLIGRNLDWQDKAWKRKWWSRWHPCILFTFRIRGFWIKKAS